MVDIVITPETVAAFLGAATAILAVINGLMLFRSYSLDKPKIKVKPIHPDTYQWFFNLPDREEEGKQVKRFGFLTYLAIENMGRRTATLNYWRLFPRLINGKKIELRALSIPEPSILLGKTGHKKMFNVLGCKGVVGNGETRIEGGSSIAGFAYYVLEARDDVSIGPIIKDEMAEGFVKVKVVTGRGSRTRIVFKKITTEKALALVPGIDTIDDPDGNPFK